MKGHRAIKHPRFQEKLWDRAGRPGSCRPMAASGGPSQAKDEGQGRRFGGSGLRGFQMSWWSYDIVMLQGAGPVMKEAQELAG